MKPFIDTRIGQKPLTRLQEFLNEGLKYIDAMTPTMINSGGCAFFARMLSDKLDAMGVKHTIQALVITAPEYAQKNLREYVFNGNLEAAKDSGEDHVEVEIDGVFYDSTGISQRDPLRARDIVEINKDQLSYLIEKGRWNPVFDRETLPFIQKMVDSMFEKYDSWRPHTYDFNDGRDVNLTDYTMEQLDRQRKEQFMMQFMPSFAPYLEREAEELSNLFNS